jgi:streptomycin 6-kinase
VQLPDDFEGIREAEALRFWDGHGAVRLLAHDPERKALLLERCLPGTPLGTAYDEEALDAIAALTPAEDAVLCHQDLHGGNILRAEREPWLAIDPKPIVAERAYDTVAIVRDAKPTLAELRRRLDALSELLGLDRERMRLWGLVKTLAWDDAVEAQLFSEVGSRR